MNIKKLSATTAGVAFVALGTIYTEPLYAANLGPDFQPFYFQDNLGSVPGLPTSYGGLTFLDNNTLLIGGDANVSDAGIYSIQVKRNSNNHITGFTGSASLFANAPGLPSSGGGIDGGLAFGPGNVLFYTSYIDNSIGQIEPGSNGPDKQIDLTPLGVSPSVGSLTFVPEGFAGAGRLKITSYNSGEFYDTTISPDGTGTFNIAPVSSGISIGDGPEGLAYVGAANLGFGVDSLLIADFIDDGVASYAIDANGDPIVSSRRSFLTDLDGAEGVTIDPLTGDFLFSTFSGGSSRVLAVKPIPEPSSTLGILAFGVLGGALFLKRELKRKPINPNSN